MSGKAAYLLLELPRVYQALFVTIAIFHYLMSSKKNDPSTHLPIDSIARKARRLILPEDVISKSATKSISLGAL